MIKIGSYNLLQMEMESDYGVYLCSGKERVLLPNKYVPAGLKLGDEIEVFVYTDSEDRPVATTLRPFATVGEFVYLKVKSLAAAGAFLDWGLEKDLLTPFSLQEERMEVGQNYYVKITLDELTNRVVASSKLKKMLLNAPLSLVNNQEVDAVVYKTSDLGFSAVVDGKYSGILYRNQVFSPIIEGKVFKAYIMQIRDDGKIDLAMQPTGYRAMVDSASEKILATLVANNGKLNITSKTGTDEIQKIFHMSKKTFKKALGGLYKSRVVEIDDNCIKIK